MSDERPWGSGVALDAALQPIVERLASESKARLVFLLHREGHMLAVSGEGENRSLDATSLASLTAGNLSAARAIAALLGEVEFEGQLLEGQESRVYLKAIGKAILVVIFDLTTSLGLVRLRVRKASGEIDRLLAMMLQAPPQWAPTSDVLDEIDDLFSG